MSDEVMDIESLPEVSDINESENYESGNDSEVSQTDTNEADESDVSEGKSDTTDKSDTKFTGKSIREAVKAASEQFPEQAKLFKQLADSHFRVESAYKQSFGTPQEAAAAKNLIEAVGGLDGLTSIQERISSYELQDGALKEGNPEVLDSIFTDFPEGAAALAPHYLEKLFQSNPQAAANAITPYLANFLQNSKIGDYFDALMSETDPQRSQAYAATLKKWFEGQVSGAKEIQVNRPNPVNDKLAQERQAINEEREQLFVGQVNERVNNGVTTSLNNEIAKYVKQYKLNDSQTQHYKEVLLKTVTEDVLKNPNFLKQRALRYASKTRTHDNVSSYILSEFDKKLKDSAFSVVKKIYGNPKSGTPQSSGIVKSGGPKTGPNGSPIRISYQPSSKDLDWDKPNAENNFIMNKGYLKATGQFVTWQ